MAKKGKSMGSPTLPQFDIPPCQTYDKRHQGECLAGKGVYFKCQDLGHRVRGYILNKAGGFQRTNDQGQNKGKPRAFAITQE